MRAYKLETVVPPNHRISITLPESFPAGRLKSFSWQRMRPRPNRPLTRAIRWTLCSPGSGACPAGKPRQNRSKPASAPNTTHGKTDMRIQFDACMVIYFVERSLPPRKQPVTAALQERRTEQPSLCWTNLKPGRTAPHRCPSTLAAPSSGPTSIDWTPLPPAACGLSNFESH